MTDAQADNPRVIILPPLLYALGLGAGFFLQWMAPRGIVTSAARYWVGGAILAAGAVVALWGRRVMERAGTNVNPSLPATALVVTGPFRVSRNPLYVALTLMYVGVAVLANAFWVLVLVGPVLLVLHYGVVLREERYLEGKFGDVYREYRSRVRRYV